MGLEEVVGQETYTVWTEMLERLVPDGRTHRLAPMIAGMLQYTAELAYEEYGEDAEEESIASALLEASEAYGPDEVPELLQEVVDQLFADAGVESERVTSQGDDYSLAESAIYEFIHWYDMPWEA
jgi:hypothetical protein